MKNISIAYHFPIAAGVDEVLTSMYMDCSNLLLECRKMIENANIAWRFQNIITVNRAGVHIWSAL